MKALILSDIHGNWDALQAVAPAPGEYDEIWVLGDLVNYGPQPNEVVAWVAEHASVVLCGNHDYALAHYADPRCSPPYRRMAAEMGRYTDAVLTPEHREFLRGLPQCLRVDRDGRGFYLCHAMPSDPLFGYCPADSPRWEQEWAVAAAEVLLCGHTHVPFVRRVGPQGRGIVANPGSVGQPKGGSPQATYAVWTGEELQLRSVFYPWQATAEKLQAIPLTLAVRAALVDGLRTGQGNGLAA
jgi:predicted phosphodiesterase